MIVSFGKIDINVLKKKMALESSHFHTTKLTSCELFYDYKLRLISLSIECNC